MDLTVESIALAAVFLLPGYAAYRLTGYFTRTPQRRISTLDTILTSLGTTLGILVVEGLVATLIAAVIFLTKESWLDKLELEILLLSGLRAYAAEHPWVVILAVTSTAVVTASAAFGWGLIDPIGRRLKRRQIRLGISPDDMWVTAFEQDRDTLGYKHANVSVKLKKSGDVFQGRVRGFSFPAEQTESRDLYLRYVTYIAGGIVTLDAKANPRSAAIISSENIESINIIFQ